MNCQKRHNTLLFGILTCALVVGFSDTARAQTVSVSPSTLNFTNIPSGAVSSQQISVSSSESTTLIINTSGVPSWLSVSPSGAQNVLSGSPLTLTVTVNTTGLASGAFVGTFSISVNGSNQAAATVFVDLTVNGTSALTSSPTSLSFSTTVGTIEQNIPTQQVTISSSITALSYTVSASTSNGTNWLVPFTTSGNTSASNIITIGVNPAGLTANTYTGSILVQSTSTSDSVAIPVTLTLSGVTTLSVTPATLPTFLYQIGGTLPAAETLMVSSTNSISVPFTVAMSPQVSWLVFNLNGSTGTAGAAVPETFSVNATGLTAGSYSTQVTFTNTVTGATLTPITAQLVVSNNPLLSISNNSLAFTAQFGSNTGPSPQTVNVTTLGSSTTSVGFTYSSDSTWLNASSTSSTTPSTLTVSVNPNGLGVGTYAGNIFVSPSSGVSYSLDIKVTLTVTNAAQVTAGPGALLFSYELTQAAPAAQLVQISANGGQSVTFTASASATATTNCPAGWLEVNTNSIATPATLAAIVNPSGLAAGTCTGSITISYGTSSSISIPITLNVSASTPLLNVSMPVGFGIVSAAQGTAQLTQTINLTSSDLTTPVLFSLNSSSNGSSAWLFVASSGAQTPQQLTVLIEPGSLATGVYTGTITINAPTANLPSGTFSIPVTLTITPTITVTATGLGTGNTLNFSQASGGALPAAQIVNLTGSAAGASFTSTIPSSSVCSWLTLSPQSGAVSTTGTALSVGVQTPSTGALAAGSYPCQFTLNFLNSATSSLSITATLTVGSAEVYTVSPRSLTFDYQVGGTTPASQNISVTATPNAVSITVGTTSNGGWLSTSAGSGTLQTPQTIAVSINPADIPAASLVGGQSVSGTITISAPTISSSPTVVTVTVNIVAAPTPLPTTIFNSANINGFGPIAPGELITIQGSNLGPATPLSFSVGTGNTVSSTLGGVQVMFDSNAGTPIYVSATQINVIVPWEVAGRAQTDITVLYNGSTSTGVKYNVVNATPAFYTLNSTGAGQASALNSNYSINGPAAGVVVGGNTIPTTPAAPGSEIAIYGTAGGVTNPGGTDGTVTPTTQLYPLLNASSVTATIGGQPATVYFVGAAPGEVTGVFQVNLQVPAGVSGNALPVAIIIDGVTTITGPTIAVQ